MSAYLMPSDILLPDFETVNGTAFATIACDQFTSDPAYWQSLDARVGDAPSTLRLILPEAFLNETEERVPQIHEQMEHYMRKLLKKHPNSMIYLERTLSDGKVRRGLVGMIDLENYDYAATSTSLIRPTEATVPERIPPRLAVRRGAVLELPHVMLLVDDPEKTVIEPLAERRESLETVYDFPLIPGSGAVWGALVDSVGLGRVQMALERLLKPSRIAERYGEGAAPLLFAVGDGNHSLAVAKANYEEIKAARGEAAKCDPARYALVEVVNLHDPALQFEPIYRVMTGVDPDEVLAALQEYSFSLHGTCPAQQARFLSAKRRGTIHFEKPSAQLTVETLQQFIDKYLAEHPGAEVDYIHGSRTVEALSAKENTVGFLFSGMAKDDLFRTVIREGSLPRKTFSMGHAEDKRFYLECRRIK
ncbi:MAG: DUF1015 domain-containing protein [Clostridia bacterium]|nr:DUF1015 domain-containing protein [Clostridia bacterium]